MTSFSQENSFFDVLELLEKDENFNNSNINENKKITYTLNEISELEKENKKPSALETNYSERAGEELKQFGYRLFERRFINNTFIQGAIQDDYILGVGDNLVLILYGAVNSTIKSTVSNDGTVFFKT